MLNVDFDCAGSRETTFRVCVGSQSLWQSCYPESVLGDIAQIYRRDHRKTTLLVLNRDPLKVSGRICKDFLASCLVDNALYRS